MGERGSTETRREVLPPDPDGPRCASTGLPRQHWGHGKTRVVCSSGQQCHASQVLSKQNERLEDPAGALECVGHRSEGRRTR